MMTMKLAIVKWVGELFYETGRRIAGDTERSIYEALEVPWQEPWERR